MEENESKVQPGEEPGTIVVKDAEVTKPTKVVFGFGEEHSPTPKSVESFFRLYTLIVAIAAITVNGFAEVDVHVKNYILEGVTTSILIADKIKSYFGIKADNS